jgi:hypothetical protein
MPATMAEKLEEAFTIMNKNWVLFCLIWCVCSCKKNTLNNQQADDFFNPVYVDFYVNLNLPDAANLKFPNGHMYSNFGYKGIIIYNTGFSGPEQYVAFDRACPYQTDSSCAKVSLENNGLFLACGTYSGNQFVKCCHSKFSAQNGGVVSGEAKRGLKQYFVNSFGAQLRISSNPNM